MQNWQDFNDECIRCGSSDIRVLTSAEVCCAYDGDDVECLSCGLLGSVCHDGEENSDGYATCHVDWDDYIED